jgi:hypothetical protein
MRSVVGTGRVRRNGTSVLLEAPGLDVPLTVNPSLAGLAVPHEHAELAEGKLIDFCGELPNQTGNVETPAAAFSNLMPSSLSGPTPFLVVVQGALFKQPEHTPPEMKADFWSADLLYRSVPGDRKSGSWIRLRVEGVEGAGNNHLSLAFQQLTPPPDGPLPLLAVGTLRSYRNREDKTRSYIELISFQRVTAGGNGYKPTSAIASSFDPAETQPIEEEVPF